jgi:diacylglycerol kinase family enzyme
MPVNTDGEIVTATPAHFKVHPGAVAIFAPEADPRAEPMRMPMFHR